MDDAEERAIDRDELIWLEEEAKYGDAPPPGWHYETTKLLKVWAPKAAWRAALVITKRRYPWAQLRWLRKRHKHAHSTTLRNRIDISCPAFPRCPTFDHDGPVLTMRWGTGVIVKGV